MLKELMKAAGLTSDKAEKPQAAQAEGTGLVVKFDAAQMAEIQASIDAAVAEAKAEFESYKETAEGLVAAAEAQVASLTAQLTEAQVALAAAAAEKQALVEDAETKRLNARKEKIVAAIGEAKAPALMAATESLDDAAFDAVVSALVGGVAAEANSPLFKEVGVAAEADASKVVLETPEMRALKDKYGDAASKQ